jgi:GMP synthase (glutamine-hydrolysing)
MQTGGIVILDFGSQFTQLIAKSIRKQHVFSQILSCKASKEDILLYQPNGIILSGGPSSVFEPDAPRLPGYLLELGLPVLGICYGMQLLALALDATVEKSGSGEYGFTMIETTGDSTLFAGTPQEQQVWMSHGDKITGGAAGMKKRASSGNCEFAAFSIEERRLYAVQFHPEVHHTVHGQRILSNFLFDICKCANDWLPENIVQSKIDEIRRTVVGGRTLCAVSGGVDSSVTAALVSRAIGENLVCAFVDNGLLREGERDAVENFMGKQLSSPLQVIDARERFIARLKGVTDPEEKRRRIGNLFIEVFEEVSAELGPFEYLAQGTLYPDRIESTSTFGPSDTIKTHHNVGGLPERLNFTLIEPLSFLFKDEVRELGAALGLPGALIGRHPFPGPGLAVRVLGEVTEEKLSLLRKADKIFIDGLIKWNLYDQVWQAGVILLPVKSVGVMGDARTYNYVVALRAVNSADGMTADWSKLESDFLKEVSNEIINSVRGINRVVYDISSKPPSTIEWE